ncbi:MAG TPA: metallophosphoesterase family protein, partial [Burkholderiales bacterium]|nr:metallophosphoesterase family protein [Burkholderiales bacterium]
AVKFLRGSDLILHTGDIGKAEVLEQLEQLAPVKAVRGNNDHGGWANAVPYTDVFKVEHVVIFAIHDASALGIHRVPADARVVVCGHSHRPIISERAGVLYVNPGSAGPRRFKLPIAVGELRVKGNSVRVRIAELEIAP